MLVTPEHDDNDLFFPFHLHVASIKALHLAHYFLQYGRLWNLFLSTNMSIYGDFSIFWQKRWWLKIIGRKSKTGTSSPHNPRRTFWSTNTIISGDPNILFFCILSFVRRMQLSVLSTVCFSSSSVKLLRPKQTCLTSNFPQSQLPFNDSI